VLRPRYLWASHLVLQAVRHVGRVPVHRHVHGHVDTHAGEHVVVLGRCLGPSCGTSAKHCALVLRPHAVLRGSVTAARGHHLRQTSSELIPCVLFKQKLFYLVFALVLSCLIIIAFKIYFFFSLLLLINFTCVKEIIIALILPLTLILRIL
jgi:hypothetical protein